MIAHPVLVYFAVCLICSLFGIGTKLGFLGTLILSVFLTPLVSMFVLLCMERFGRGRGS